MWIVFFLSLRCFNSREAILGLYTQIFSVLVELVSVFLDFSATADAKSPLVSAKKKEKYSKILFLLFDFSVVRRSGV